MSATTAWVLIGAGAATATVGVVLLWASSGRARRGEPPAGRPFAGRVGPLARTSVVCGVITGAQWAVLDASEPGAVWVAVLWLPAFLAAATVTRLLTLLWTLLGRRRREQAVRRGRGCRR